MKKRVSLLCALALSCSYVYAANAGIWAELGAAGDIEVTDDIDATPSSLIQINADKTINGNNHSLTGASGAYFDVKGGENFTFKNFGQLSDGSESSNTFSYTDKTGSIIYKTIEKSVNSFTSSVFQINNKSNITVDNSVFYNNSAESGKYPASASVLRTTTADTISITNSTFYNNSANKGKGGVLYAEKGSADGGTISVLIENSIFTENSAKDSGGAIASLADKLTVLKSFFHKNKSTNYVGGGAIYNEKGSIEISDSVFSENIAYKYGGAIHTKDGKLTVTNSIFSKNQSGYGTNSRSSYGGAIYASSSGSGVGVTGLDIEGSTFTGNINSGMGGAIYVELKDSDTKSTISGSTFEKNYSTNSMGGALYLKKGDFTISGGSTFTNNHSGNGSGGAIYSDANLTLQNVTFSGNYTEGSWGASGGAIEFNGDILNINESTFNGNSTLLAEDDGGAIRINSGSQATITNSEFKSNIAGYDGGAISNAGWIKKIDKTTFDSNNAKHEGGAIWWGLDGSDEAILTNSTFNKNSSAGNGGAILFDSPEKLFVMENVDFTGNEAGSAGGAIFSRISYYQSEFAPLTIVDSSFSDNKAKEGGAIYNNGIDLNIFADTTDVEFLNNTATNNADDYNAGSDIYFDATGRDSAVLNLNASADRKLTFNGTIGAYTEGKSPVININQSGLSYVTDIENVEGTTVKMGNTGEIRFNNRIGDGNYGFDINLYSGKFSIGQNTDINKTVTNPDGFINDNNFNIKGNAILNTVNDVIGEISPKAFTIDGGLNWEYQFDVDMENKTADMIVNAVNGDGSSVNISNFNILNAPKEDEFKIKYSENNINGQLPDDYEVVIGDTTYSIKAGNSDTEGSYITVEKSVPKGGLAWAVHTQASQYIVDPEGINNGIVDSWYKNNDGTDNNTVQKDLSIDGNNLDILSNTNVNGLIVEEGIKLTLNDVNEFKGFNDSFVNKGTLVLNNTSVKNNAGSSAITNNNGDITITADKKDVLIDAGSATNAILADGGNINLNGNKLININGNVSGSNNANLNIKTNTDFNGDINSINTVQNSSIVNANKEINQGSYTLNNGLLNLNGSLSNTDFTINGGNLNIYNDFSADDFVLNGGRVSSVNNKIDNIASKNMNIKNTTDFIFDVDLQNESMDKLNADNIVYSGGKINVKAFNYLSDATKSNLKINFANDAIKDYVTNEVNSYKSKIYKYTVFYDQNDGTFNFTTPGGSNNPNNFNSAVLAAPIAAQLGGYLMQLNSYDEAFRNMDMYMLMTKEQRRAYKTANKYAAADSYLAFSPLSTPYTESAGWVRPFTTFESVKLKNGPKVSNVTYGNYAGLESKMYDLGKGWDGIISLYAGYNGSHQAYKGNSIYQNGGTLGLVGMAYKDNFFTGLTANIGANVGEANTMYGNDDFTMLMSGVASKSGYNFELADGKFIIQPNYMMSYSFVNTFDYTNAAGVRIASDPLHAIQIEPGVKFIGNLNNGWQPYAGVSVIWNVMDKTQFKANDVSLPELSVKPFVKYGVGIRKTWKDRFVGYLQTFITNGGRNGIGIQTGFRWNIGKDPSKYTNSTGEKKYIK